MDKNQKFLMIQKEVFRFCERLENSEFIQLMDDFVFDTKRFETGSVVHQFLEHTHCVGIYERHLNDLEKKPYFLSCSGSDLYYIDELCKALLVYSYNRYKNEIRDKL